MLGLVSSPTIDLSTPNRNRSRAYSRSTPTGSNSPANPGPISSSMMVDPASTALTRTAVSLEYASLRYNGHCPLGMYITPSPDNLLVWDAVFFVHQGYYTDSILKFRLTFPPNYPDRPPVVQFLTDVFHPLISQQDGKFNLSPRFRPWRSVKLQDLVIYSRFNINVIGRPKEHHVFDVLHWIKAAFKKHALDEIRESDCLNKEAYRYHDTTSSFAALATQSSMLSQSASALFDKDHPSMAGKGLHGMLFRDLKTEQLTNLRNSLGLQDWDDITPP